MRTIMKTGIVLFSAVIAYGSWEFFVKEKALGLWYTTKMREIVDLAESSMEKNRPPHVDAAGLKASARDLRDRYNTLIETASARDKSRPSFRKADDVVILIEYAAQSAESHDVVQSRFESALEGVKLLKALIGTDQDAPL